jgi:hypothetical protein
MDKTWEIVLVVVTALVVATALVVFSRELPPLRRYLRIKRM